MADRPVLVDPLEALLGTAEPPAPRPLGALVTRLSAEGRLRRIVDAQEGVDLLGITPDSRRVVPGALFIAVPGAHTDGHVHAAAAVASGAVAVVVERELDGLRVPQLIVDTSRRGLASAACWWYGDPSRSLAVVGVTGTDGKTSTSRLAVAALESAGLSTGLVSTAEIRVGGVDVANPVHSTTPEAPDLQRLLRAMVDRGDSVAVVETTSHGLALERVAGVAYDAAIFTNVTHEHLELHGTFEAYRAAKLRLFEALATAQANPMKGPGGVTSPGAWPKTGVVNADDASAPLFAAATRAAGARLVTYGEAAGAEVRLLAVHESATGLRMSVDAPSGRLDLRLGLLGRFNAWNALAVVALAEAVGLDRSAVLDGLAAAPPVTGRMERIDHGQPFTVVVDYAHSPAALRTVLDLLAPLATRRGGRLIAVFGSAGERDVLKRPIMGRIAAERCGVVVVTDEDPRGEDRMAILDAIAAGAESGGRRRGEDLLVVPDRREAIVTAFASARAGDVVLLAGKGHETSIIAADGPHPWDERAAAEEELARLGWIGRA